MNFLIDESVDAPIARRLRDDGHQVNCVWELEPGIDDKTVLDAANRDGAVLVTADKDFGELVFRLKRAHHGVLLIRLTGILAPQKAQIVSDAVRQHADDLRNAFTVVTPGVIRVRGAATTGSAFQDPPERHLRE